ncbi:MAG: magnesium transporter [Chloroflexota bacterium]
MVNPTSVAIEELEQAVRDALEAENLEALRTQLATIQFPDLADLIERLDGDQEVQVFRLIPEAEKTDVLHELGVDATRTLFEQLSADEIAELLNQMPMDDAAEIFTEDVPERQEELLSQMRPSDAAEVRTLLKYPPQSAGRLMTEKYVRLDAEMSVEAAIAKLRKINPEVETITDMYVLDADEQLIGALSLRELITAPTGSLIGDVMSSPVISVTAETDREDVARMVARYDFLAMPVTDGDKHMLGVITVDDILHVLVEEGTEDALKFGAVEGGVINQPYFTVPMRRVIRSRVGWLLLLFVAETLTGSVLRLFEVQLAEVVALSFFIPLLIGTGGNTGAQTVSTIIRGLALKEITLSDSLRVVRRELVSGLLLGLLLGTVAFFRTILWGGLDLRFCLVIGLTILAICTWANTIGSIIPLLAHKLKIDPAVVSAPLITTLVDATGLAIYLLIAKVLLQI